MNPIRNPSDLSYVHPALAVVTLLLGFYVFSLGLKQRDQRVRRAKAPPLSPGNLKRHVALGPLVALLFCASATGGVASAVVFRGWRPLGTVHGWLGVSATVLMLTLWWLGRRLLAQQKQLAPTHGLVGVAAVFLAGVAALLGIELLP